MHHSQPSHHSRTAVVQGCATVDFHPRLLPPLPLRLPPRSCRSLSLSLTVTWTGRNACVAALSGYCVGLWSSWLWLVALLASLPLGSLVVRLGCCRLQVRTSFGVASPSSLRHFPRPQTHRSSSATSFHSKQFYSSAHRHYFQFAPVPPRDARQHSQVPNGPLPSNSTNHILLLLQRSSSLHPLLSSLQPGLQPTSTAAAHHLQAHHSPTLSFSFPRPRPPHSSQSTRRNSRSSSYSQTSPWTIETPPSVRKHHRLGLHSRVHYPVRVQNPATERK